MEEELCNCLFLFTIRNLGVIFNQDQFVPLHGGGEGEGKGRIRNASLSNFRVCRSEVKTAVITNGERASDSPQVLALLTSLEPQRTKLASESNAGIHHLGRGRESIVQTAGPSFFHCTVNGLFQPSVLTAFNF